MNEEFDIEEWAPWLVVVITLFGGWLRSFMLIKNELGFDEIFSLWLSSHSIVDMLQWTARIDPNPPLYYFLLHYWIALNGVAPYYLRLLAVLFGAITIPIVYLIGKRMSGALVGLAAAIFLACSPFNIRLAQETRMYTLLAFNASVAIYALVRLLTDPRAARPIGGQFREYLQAWRTSRPLEPDPEREFSYQVATRDQTGWRAWISRHRLPPIQAMETDLAWVALILFSAATLYSHNTAVLFLLAANLFVLGLMLYQRGQKSGPPPAFQAPSLGNWVKAQIAILILWSPWIIPFIQQAGRVYQEFGIPRPDWAAVIQTLGSFINESTLGQGGQVIVVWILYALVLGLGLVHFRKKFSQFLFLAALFVIPILGELIVSLRRPIFYDRTLIWITIPVFLLLAAGIARLRPGLLILVVLGILGANNLFSAGDYYRFAQSKEDWSRTAGFVAKYIQNGDLILFNATPVQIPFDYYFKPYEDQYFLQVEEHGVPVDLFGSGFLSGVPNPKMAESDIPRLTSLLSGRKTVWLVYSQDRNADPMGLIPQTLASEMKFVQQRDFNRVQVQIYQAP